MLALPHFANPAWITMRCLASLVPLGRTSRVGVLRRLNDKPNSMAAQLRDAASEQQECSTGYYRAYLVRQRIALQFFRIFKQFDHAFE
jgi:hypothetical protein